MNSIAPIEPALPRAPFEAARDAAAAWRGRCLDQFARCEAAVTETLIVLAAIEARGGAITLPHLVGQRYDALAQVTAAGGAFAEEGKAVAAALVQYREHDALRTQIAHGVFTVTLDHRGSWHLVLRVLALRSGRQSRDLRVIEEAEATEILHKLEKDGNRLRSTLGQLRKHFLAP